MIQPSDAQRVERPTRSAFSRWVYLVFFSFIFIGLVFSPNAGLREWGLEIAVVAISLPIFVVSALRDRPYPGAIALMVIALAVTPLDSSALSVLPIYSAGLIGSRGTRRQLVQRLGLITLVVVIGTFISPIPWPFRMFLLIPAIMVWVVGLGVFEDASLSAHANVLHAENRRIAHLATMAERERIARDLHDLAGQALTAITLRSQLIQRLAESDATQTVTEAARIEAMARDTLGAVRETVAGWHQASLTDELYVATEALTAAGAAVETEGDWHLDLAPSVETVMAMALREAVTNIVRHSHARHVGLRLDATDDGGVQLRVTDDGVGHNGDEGSGLRGMRERVLAAGGTIELAGTVGTSLTIDMPFGGRTQ